MAAGITILTAALLLTPGCVKNTTTAPPCDGFGGGNIVGKWKFRFIDPNREIEIMEYRADRTYRQESIYSQDPREGTYEVDGNLVRTQYRTGNATARGERCFDVQGSVLKERDKNAGKEISTSYYDRV